MPIIEVNMVEGRTQEKKENMMRRVTEVVAETLECSTADVRIIIREMNPHHYSVDGDTFAKIKGLK